MASQTEGRLGDFFKQLIKKDKVKRARMPTKPTLIKDKDVKEEVKKIKKKTTKSPVVKKAKKPTKSPVVKKPSSKKPSTKKKVVFKKD